MAQRNGTGGADEGDASANVAVVQVTAAYDSDDDFAFTCATEVMYDDDTADAATIDSVCLTQGIKQKSPINNKWLLLDSEATKHIFCNRKLLTDIKHCPKGILVHGQFGNGRTHWYGTAKGVKYRVWLNENGLANILALCLMRRQFRITYDNWNNGACFIVHKTDGTVVRFVEHEGGLYFHDIRARKLPKIETSLAVVETVRGNKK